MPEVFFLAGYTIYFSTLDREHGVHVHVARGNQRDIWPGSSYTRIGP